MGRFVLSWVCVCTLVALPVGGCGETAGTEGGGGSADSAGSGGSGGDDASAYAAKDLWLCRPDIENDQCDIADLSFTEMRSDGSRVTGDVASNPDAPIDCFYVYHTVTGEPEPGNAGNAEILSPPDPAVVQALLYNGAHFRGVCRMFAPLYHQMDLSTYYSFVWAWLDTEFFARAYGDVVEAFEYYLRVHNDGRDFVLVGHSQGSHIFAKLLEDKFDNDASLRAQLLSAILIGPTNVVQVAEGERVGGNFENIPLCTTPSETGCVIAFDAVAADTEYTRDSSVPLGPGLVRACVNPASFDGETGVLSGTLLSRVATPDLVPATVDTAWVRYPDMYEARCSEDHVLQVDVAERDPTDPRDVPITPQDLQASFRFAHLHDAETFLTVPTLVRIVEQQVQSRDN